MQINLYTHAIGYPQQLWRLERIPDKPKQTVDTDSTAGDQGGVSTSTVTTTADKVTTITTTISVKTSISTQKW